MLYVYMYSINTQLYNTTYGNDVHDLSDNTRVQIKIYLPSFKTFLLHIRIKIIHLIG